MSITSIITILIPIFTILIPSITLGIVLYNQLMSYRQKSHERSDHLDTVTEFLNRIFDGLKDKTFLKGYGIEYTLLKDFKIEYTLIDPHLNPMSSIYDLVNG